MENSLRPPAAPLQDESSCGLERSFAAGNGAYAEVTPHSDDPRSGEVSEIDRELEAALEYKLAFGGAKACAEVLNLMMEVINRHRPLNTSQWR